MLGLGMKNKIRGTASMLRASFLGSIVSVDTRNKEVAITFDDGPHPEFTPKVLDVLLRYDAKATFFMLGIMAQKYPDLVKRVAEGGHEIGNHSWDHPSLPAIPTHEIKNQLMQTKQLLAPYGQTFIRPPFGHQNSRSFLVARLCGYQVVLWDRMAGDWLDKDAEWLAKNLLKKIKPGSIILFHDSLYQVLEEQYRNRQATIRAVEKILQSLPEYKFVTVSTLMAGGVPVKRYWAEAPPDDFLGRLKVGPI